MVYPCFDILNFVVCSLDVLSYRFGCVRQFVGINIGLLYNTHATLSAYTHEQLAHFNHRQLREEPLDVHHNEYGDLDGLTHGQMAAFTHDQLFRSEL